MGATLKAAFLLVCAMAAQAAWGPARAGDLSEADEALLVAEAHGAACELQSAKLAPGKATRKDVGDQAEKLINDHERYDVAPMKLGEREGLALPTEPDDAGRAHLKDLGEVSGTAFDDLYVKEALRIDAEDERDGDEEKSDTEDQAIKDVLAEFDDMDKAHGRLAKPLEKANG